ncbi:MAG: hypothetical protein AB7P08_15900 [Burkholderiales bacterium]
MRRPALALVFLLPSLALPGGAASAPQDDSGKARAFAHELKAGAVAEECLRLDAGRSRRFAWSADAPVDFNIHFHHGDKVSYPVKANGRKSGGGRFTAATAEDYCWMWTAKQPARVTGTLEAQE